MAKDEIPADPPRALRREALDRLAAPASLCGNRPIVSGALRVLYDLASSPATAEAALALLHELQVHQIEIDLQNEELRRSRVDLETSWARQMQLYECSPVGCFTVDRSTVLWELNLTAAGMLGTARDALLGRRLDLLLSPASGQALQAILTRVIEGAPRAFGTLHLVAGTGAPRKVHASASCDPQTPYFLLSFMETDEG